MTVLMTEVDKSAVSGSKRLLKELPREKLVWMLQRMCEIRYFEEKAEDLYVRGLGAWHHAPVDRAGSRIGRQYCHAETRRSDHPPPSRPRSYDCQRRQPDDDDGRVPGQGNGLLPRARRFDAHCRHPGRQPGRHGCRRRRDPHRGGHRAGAANAPFGPDSPVLLWRWGLERRRVPRIVEYGLHLETAGGVYLR